MDVFATRRPIFDNDAVVYGYELLFRRSMAEYFEMLHDPDAAKQFGAFLGIGELVNTRRAFVRFTRAEVLRGLPALLPVTNTVVLVPALEASDERGLAACAKLREFGVRMALDGPESAQKDHPLLKVAGMVRLNFAEGDPEVLVKTSRRLRSRGTEVIADGITTAKQYEALRNIGCTLFAGEFFRKPLTHGDGRVSPDRVANLRLLLEVSKPELPYEKIARLITQDVQITYRLLRFMNSAWFGLHRQVSSVKHALVLLGPKRIKRWVSVFVVTGTGEGKPRELLRRALIRARVAELLAPRTGLGAVSGELYLMGMFSAIDTLVDAPIEAVLEELPLSDEIKSALTGQASVLAPVLRILESYESGQWDRFATEATQVGLPEDVVPGVFREAYFWAEEALEGVQ